MLLSEQDAFFEKLYDDMFDNMKTYARVQLHDPFGVEEVVQDAFYTALQQLEQLRQHSNPKGCLMQILKYKIKEYKRAHSRALKFFLSLDDNPLPEARAPSNDFPVSTSSILKTIREVLTTEEYYLFHRIILNGASHMEMSVELGITVWSSQKRLERIRRKLKDVLPGH